VIPRVETRNGACTKVKSTFSLSPDGRKQIPPTSATLLSPHRPWNVLAKLRLIGKLLRGFEVINSQYLQNKSLCAVPELIFGNLSAEA
jgi:hypothetical protein